VKKVTHDEGVRKNPTQRAYAKEYKGRLASVLTDQKNGSLGIEGRLTNDLNICWTTKRNTGERKLPSLPIKGKILRRG